MLAWIRLLAGLVIAGMTVVRVAKVDAASYQWDCNRKWPELELFLPINTNPHRKMPERDSEYYRIYIRSLLLFWPLQVSNTKLLFVADSENKETTQTRAVRKILLDMVAPHVPGGIRIEYNDPLYIDSSRGHDRQQRLMFYADIYSSSEYVGFVDTDCMFVTYVDREDLFENGKPVVIGRIGNYASPENGPGYDWWARIPKTTYQILGIKEPMRCMSYFPVIVKTAHIKEMREFMEKKHKKPFNFVFKEFMNHPYSQFNIMCAYLFAFHRDEYVWYVNDISPDWDYQNPPPSEGQETNKSLFTEEMRQPKPRIAMHSNYWSPRQQRVTERDEHNIMRTGVCIGPPFPKLQYPQCNFYSKEEDYQSYVYDEMFKFEMVDWLRYLPPDQVRKAMYERFQRIQNCTHTYIHPDLKKLMTP